MEWFQVSIAKKIIATHFCVVMQRVVAISCLRFGTTYRFHLEGSRLNKTGLTGCPETLVRNYHCSLHNNSKQRSSARWYLYLFAEIVVFNYGFRELQCWVKVSKKGWKLVSECLLVRITYEWDQQYRNIVKLILVFLNCVTSPFQDAKPNTSLNRIYSEVMIKDPKGVPLTDKGGFQRVCEEYYAYMAPMVYTRSVAVSEMCPVSSSSTVLPGAFRHYSVKRQRTQEHHQPPVSPVNTTL